MDAGRRGCPPSTPEAHPGTESPQGVLPGVPAAREMLHTAVCVKCTSMLRACPQPSCVPAGTGNHTRRARRLPAELGAALARTAQPAGFPQRGGRGRPGLTAPQTAAVQSHGCEAATRQLEAAGHPQRAHVPGQDHPVPAAGEDPTVGQTRTLAPAPVALSSGTPSGHFGTGSAPSR